MVCDIRSHRLPFSRYLSSGPVTHFNLIVGAAATAAERSCGEKIFVLTVSGLSLCPRVTLPFCALFWFRERCRCPSANDGHSIRHSMWSSHR